MGGVSRILGGGSSERSSSSQPTAFQSLPPEAREAFTSALNRIRPFTEDVSSFEPLDFTPDQLEAFDRLRSGTPGLTQERFEDQLGIFMNPFEEQALQGTFEDIRRGGRGVLSDIGAGASAAGGFGGTRQALLEGETQRNVLEQIGRTGAQARANAFERASDRALGRIAREEDLGRLDIESLLRLGDITQNQQQQQRFAPLTAAQTLLQAAQGFPVGGGQTSTSRSSSDEGLLSPLGGSLFGLGGLFNRGT